MASKRPSGLPGAKAYFDDQCTHTIKLEDGRMLAFAVYGCGEDDHYHTPISESPSDAPTVFYMHSALSSRLQAARFHPAAQKLGVRVVGIDRPGIGLSTGYNKGTKAKSMVMSWPADVKQLAGHLKVDRYYILGYGMSTPYALACAKMLPTEELLGIGLLAAGWPWKKGTKGAPMPVRLGLNMMVWFPRLMRLQMDRTTVKLAHDKDQTAWKKNQEMALTLIPREDREIWDNNPELWELAHEATKEAFRQKSKGVVDDFKAISSPWPFHMKDVGFRGVRLWYGDADPSMPAKVGRYISENIPGSVLKEFEGKTNLEIDAEYLEEVLVDLVESGRRF